MARDNYSYQKYRRELAKKKKNEEKMQKKLDKKNKQPEGTPEQASGDIGAITPDQSINGQDNKIQ